MQVHEYYLDGERHLSEQMMLTGRQLLERSPLASKESVLYKVNGDEGPIKIAENARIIFTEEVPHFMTVKRGALVSSPPEPPRNNQFALQLLGALNNGA